jgi:hypothetical protein
MEQCEQIRGGLARARLCLPGDVLPVESERQRFALNGRAMLKARFADSAL